MKLQRSILAGGQPDRIRKQRSLVAVAMGSSSEPEFGILEGIRSGAAEWDLVVLSGGYETPLRKLAETGELAGAIGDFVSDAWVEDLRKKGVRIVQLAQGSKLTACVNVGADFVQMGHDAVEAFVRSGFRTIGLVGVPGHHATDQMHHGASAHPRVANATVQLTTAATLPLLQTWLAAMPRPCGVLAVSDRLARIVIAAAHNLEWKIPEDVAVVGVGNQRVESVFAGIPISSFELPSRAIGRAAADAMKQMMEKYLPRKFRNTIFPARLIERDSSLLLPNGVRRAIAFAEAHYAEAIQVDDLARASGMSRRALELATQAEHGLSPAGIIAGIRRREAERLLRTLDLSIAQVGGLCGYPEPERFSAAFKRWTGLSPREFRKSMLL